MTLNDALKMLQKEEPDLVFDRYVKVKNGFVFFEKIELNLDDDYSGIYLVTKDGEVELTNPLNVEWNDNNIRNIF